MSSLIDTIALMKESVHAISGQPPKKIYLGRKVKEAFLQEVAHNNRYDEAPSDDCILGMEVVEVSNDPYTLAITDHVVQQALPL